MVPSRSNFVLSLDSVPTEVRGLKELYVFDSNIRTTTRVNVDGYVA